MEGGSRSGRVGDFGRGLVLLGELCVELFASPLAPFVSEVCGLVLAATFPAGWEAERTVLGLLVATRDGLSVSFLATGVFVVVDGWRVAGLTGVLGVFGATGDLTAVVGARFVASCPE
jgi:hypothetical protein